MNRLLRLIALVPVLGAIPITTLASDRPEGIHTLAPEHLPRFLPTADGSDPLFNIVLGLVILIVLVGGNLYMRLHALPERMAHRQNSAQLQLVAVLALIALFTHNNIFWVLALLLAAIRLPDYQTPLNTMAASLSEMKDQIKGGGRDA